MEDDFIHLEDPNNVSEVALVEFERATQCHPTDVNAVLLQLQDNEEIPGRQTARRLKIAANLSALLDATNNGFSIDYGRPFLYDVLDDPTYKSLVAGLKELDGPDRPAQIRKMALRGLTIYVQQRLSQNSEAG